MASTSKYQKCRTCEHVEVLWSSLVSVTSKCPKSNEKGYVKKADCETCYYHKMKEEKPCLF